MKAKTAPDTKSTPSKKAGKTDDVAAKEKAVPVKTQVEEEEETEDDSEEYETDEESEEEGTSGYMCLFMRMGQHIMSS